MTVKKRLAISNILMILVPVCITMLIAGTCLAIIRISLDHGTRIDLTDPDDFPEVSRRVTSVIERIIEKPQRGWATEFSLLDKSLGKNNISYSITGNGITASGGIPVPSGIKKLLQAAALLDNEGYVSDGTINLYSCHITVPEGYYLLRLYGCEKSIPYTMLTHIIIFSAIVLACTIFVSVFLTNRFLIRFIFRKIEQPLDILANGVHQIHAGNLDYRINYRDDDEFTPVCIDFNAMAVQLKTSVNEVKQHEKNRKELFAGISHDLRSPLTSIQAYVEGILDGVAITPDMQHRYLVTIKQKSEELAYMISELLLFSKMDMDEFPIHIQRVDLATEISGFVQAYRKDHSADSIKIRTDLETAVISADPELLRRVFDNIVGNSLKYKVQDSCTVHIVLQKHDGDVVLSFRDNGPGVLESQLPKLFDVFYRCDGSRQNPGKGSGLGLAITAKAVEHMHGTVAAKNVSSGGLAIRITFPETKE